MKNDTKTRESILDRTSAALRQVEARAHGFVSGDPCPICGGTDMLMFGGRDSSEHWCRACGSVVSDDGTFVVPQCSTATLAKALREAMPAPGSFALSGEDLGERMDREAEGTFANLPAVTPEHVLRQAEADVKAMREFLARDDGLYSHLEDQTYREQELDAEGKPTGRWLTKRLLG